ncbi:MAG: helix-turn-helix domain-containing protein, partial [Candidatus Marinimicrobia bacterium]|nr:helix-turn-helix domain-containing protein [Candidatus Neomarinimicrobiota bacterium]
MAQFYKELKELRLSQNISLEDISDRTKIHIQYLKSIENGDFNKIEVPYLRLFLRAYAVEIGGDATRSLEQLDSFMGTTRTLVRNSSSLEDEKNTDKNLKAQIPSFLNSLDQKKRNEIIKGGFFSIIFIFAIIISQKIFNQDSHAINTKNGPILQNIAEPITNKILLKNFVVD